jgi:hypothetical protein
VLLVGFRILCGVGKFRNHGLNGYLVLLSGFRLQFSKGANLPRGTTAKTGPTIRSVRMGGKLGGLQECIRRSGLVGAGGTPEMPDQHILFTGEKPHTAITTKSAANTL